MNNHGKGPKLYTKSLWINGKDVEYTVHLYRDSCTFFLKCEDEDFQAAIKEHFNLDWYEMSDLSVLFNELKKVETRHREACVEEISTETKVILYDIKILLSDADGEEIRDDFNCYGDHGVQVSFDYQVAIRVDVNGSFMHHKHLDGSLFNSPFEYEVEHSSEREIFVENIYTTLEKVAERLDAFFGQGISQMMLTVDQGLPQLSFDDKKKGKKKPR